ncbi:hypothetical protein [Spirochaeta africana]|uniref:Phage protein, HK97 gp10 family n=1 Tax=Spirochaeta africana (strain ATCC 700263 / DSM 8902 / Z-7692) TaxID=889378 RepID=H9UJD9_SPIAZ|nr:hypothetical protein [Spirochaeta africana]AFG37632.1 hypothetical protein Spiaf_1573 [Spirochaeta africana DSM 8902]
MYEVSGDLQEIKKALTDLGLERNTRTIQRRILRRLGSKARTVAKRSYRANLGKETGELYRSIRHRLTKKGSVIISPTGGKNLMKGNVLQSGAVIRPTSGEFLTYQINGKWIKSRVSIIRPRNWFYQAVDAFANSAEAQRYIEEQLEREVTRIWERANK